MADDLETKIAAKRAELAVLQRQAREARQRTKPEPRRFRFTKGSVAALPAPRAGLAIYWDADMTGLGLRVSPAGRKVYFLQQRTRAGRAIKLTLGRADRITATQAREAAELHLAAIALGRDPAAELGQARAAERARRLAATVDQVWQDFLMDHMAARRPKTQGAYQSWYRLHIKPQLGRTKVADLTREHVKRLHRSVTEAVGPSTANRVLAVLSSLLTYAVDRELVPANVAKGAVERHREEGRERVLADAELRALIGHLDGSTTIEARVVAFLLATGCRRGEALAARWSDLAGSWWTIPASVSKSGKAVRRPLNAAAADVLARTERRGALLFQGATEGRLSRWWQGARKQLGLDGVRLHDMRHVAASLAINSGVPLAAVGRLLGHGAHSASMSARYSHISDEALAQAAAAVADRLQALRDAEPAGRA